MKVNFENRCHWLKCFEFHFEFENFLINSCFGPTIERLLSPNNWNNSCVSFVTTSLAKGKPLLVGICDKFNFLWLRPPMLWMIVMIATFEPNSHSFRQFVIMAAEMASLLEHNALENQLLLFNIWNAIRVSKCETKINYHFWQNMR